MDLLKRDVRAAGLAGAPLPEQCMLTDALERVDGEIFGNSPGTKARTAEQSRWEDGIQEGEMFELGGKKQLREGIIES